MGLQRLHERHNILKWKKKNNINDLWNHISSGKAARWTPLTVRNKRCQKRQIFLFFKTLRKQDSDQAYTRRWKRCNSVPWIINFLPLYTLDFPWQVPVCPLSLPMSFPLLQLQSPLMSLTLIPEDWHASRGKGWSVEESGRGRGKGGQKLKRYMWWWKTGHSSIFGLECKNRLMDTISIPSLTQS